MGRILRGHDPAGASRRVAPKDCVAWYRDVAAAIALVPATDGSCFLLWTSTREEACGDRDDANSAAFTADRG